MRRRPGLRITSSRFKRRTSLSATLSSGASSTRWMSLMTHCPWSAPRLTFTRCSAQHFDGTHVGALRRGLCLTQETLTHLGRSWTASTISGSRSSHGVSFHIQMRRTLSVQKAESTSAGSTAPTKSFVRKARRTSTGDCVILWRLRTKWTLELWLTRRRRSLKKSARRQKRRTASCGRSMTRWQHRQLRKLRRRQLWTQPRRWQGRPKK
mmetsp:Transcript_15261/g.26439  ORF Transcript_15261/g.26439 Transcript_15261/m.26439 type:complete len:209 (-) Transcript_15261:1920-2546(-)